jgi:hypothetical protein
MKGGFPGAKKCPGAGPPFTRFVRSHPGLEPIRYDRSDPFNPHNPLRIAVQILESGKPP